MADLTLDETWSGELSMRIWIVEQLDNMGIEDPLGVPGGPHDDIIDEFEEDWLQAHGVTMRQNGFFCDWSHNHTGQDCPNCGNCPGILVDEDFDCEGSAYHHRQRPHAFLAKLMELNAKRKKRR